MANNVNGVLEKFQLRVKNSPSAQALAKELRDANVDAMELDEETIHALLQLFLIASRDVA